MVTITAAQVKQLREATNVSMMECKRALADSNGDMEQATRLLRERGIAVAAKKASRAAHQGLIASGIAENGRIRSLIEVNCETDFVAKNETFIRFVAELAETACHTDEPLADRVADRVTARIAEIGENIKVRRNARFVLDRTGDLASYIHLGGKVGVLVELDCEKPETVETETFKDLIKDLTLHVAAAAPRYLTAAEVPEPEQAAEKEIYARQVGGKPPQVVEKIVEGKLNKYFAEICLLDQGFVKEPKQSITEVLKDKGRTVGDTFTVRRFVRYQLGV